MAFSSVFADTYLPKSKKSEQKEIVEIDTILSHAGRILHNPDSVKRAITLFQEAYSRSVALAYNHGEVEAAYKLGVANVTDNNNDQATRYFYISMKYAEESKDSLAISKSTLGLGLVMLGINNWESAINQFNKALQLTPSSQTKDRIQRLEYLLGIAYYNSGQLDIAKIHLEQAEKIALDKENTRWIHEARLWLNQIKSDENPNTDLIPEFNKIIDFFESESDRIGLSYALHGRSKVHFATNQLEKAKSDAITGLHLAKSLDLQYPTTLLLNDLIQIEYEHGHYQEAAELLMELKTINDSIGLLGEAAKISLINADYEFDKKELEFANEIEQQSRQRRILLYLLLGAIVIVVLIVIAMRTLSKERKKSDNLLLNILPLETAKELKTNGFAKAKAHDNVTIVFADIKSFTKIAGDLQPHVIVEMLDRYFREFDHTIKKFGLEKIKTIGDAYMFVSGLSFVENSATAAAKASLEMIESVERIKDQMVDQYGISFEFRFGMNTGSVVSGVVGDVKYAFDIWGDAVNIAARAEETSLPGKVNLTANTRDFLKSNFACTSRGSIEVKNKGSLEMYFLDNLN